MPYFEQFRDKIKKKKSDKCLIPNYKIHSDQLFEQLRQKLLFF